MFQDLVGAYGGRLVVAVLGVGAALLCLIGILWIVRGRRGPSPFVRGGRNRNPRLQVLDAAAVDTRRRLVLVRRDDVEHLIMIGGPTDIVIESRISPSRARDDDSRTQPLSQSATEAAAQPGPQVAPQAMPASAAIAAAPAKAIPAPTPRAPSMPSPAAETTAASQPRLDVPRDQPVRDMRPSQPPPVPVAASRSEPSVAGHPAPARPAVQAGGAGPVVAVERTGETTDAAPALDDAAKLLDSARDRVFSERPAQPQPAASPSAPPQMTRPAPPVTQHPTALGSDFEKILEEEMASNLAARDAALAGRGTRSPAPNGAPSIPIAGPVASIPGASRQDPPLQAEVARIFGEMSASRDK